MAASAMPRWVRWLAAAVAAALLLALSSATIIALQNRATSYRIAQLHLARLQILVTGVTYEAVPEVGTTPGSGGVGGRADAAPALGALATNLRNEALAWRDAMGDSTATGVTDDSLALARSLDAFSAALGAGDAGSAAAIHRTQITPGVSGLTVEAAAQERRLVDQVAVADRRAHLGVIGISLASAAGIGFLLWRYGRAQAGAAREQARQEAVAASEARLQALVANATDGIVVLDPTGVITYVSAAGYAILGHRPGDILGRSLAEQVVPADLDRTAAAFARVLSTPGETIVVRLHARHADGAVRQLEVTAKNLVEDPAVAGTVVNYRDVTERTELEQELRHQALHDPLTRLANRVLFRDRLDQALARRGATGHVALALVDLDDFKMVNDSYGHDAGDQLLMTIAARLRNHLRPEDTVARLGGDEFGVLAEGLPDADSTTALARRILSAFALPFEVAGRSLVMTGSVGIAVNTDPDPTGESLTHAADMAMYAAKSDGKSRWVVFDPSMSLPRSASLELRSDLFGALGTDQLSVNYQPVVDLAGGHLLGAEALVRWTHPTLGPIPQAEFIPLAEQSGLIRPLGRWVLEQACAQVARWNAVTGHTNLTVSVNLSPMQLSDPDLVDDVRVALDQAGVQPGQLVLEVTEGVLVTDEHVAVRAFTALRDLGVQIAVDDFGTGYSSLSYLRRFPIDVLKVDQSFVAGLSDGPEGAALVQAIVDIGRTLHLSTVAEGVEDARQAEGLRALHCQMARGYYFARPMPADEMATLAGAATSTGAGAHTG